MKPHIDDVTFGSITIAGEEYDHDVIIRLSKKVKKRKKKLSKRKYGTSHYLSLAEAKHIYQKGAKRLIIGTGHHDKLRLSPKAAKYLKKHSCEIQLFKTPQAMRVWNKTPNDNKTIGLFHTTC